MVVTVRPAPVVLRAADGHGREAPHRDDSAPLSPARPAFLDEPLARHAEAAGLRLAPPYRADRVAEREAADDVRAAGDRREMEVLLDGVVDVVEIGRASCRERVCMYV